MDIMEIKNQQPPFTIQIELTEGCNLGCSFCGLRGMREKGTKPWNFMTMETAKRIAQEIARVEWHSKIVFAMHGEPTLNPKIFEIIDLFHKELPNNLLYIISNGYGIANSEDPLEYVNLLEEVGVNHLLLDNYSPNGDWKTIVEAVKKHKKVIYMERGIPMFSTTKKFDVLVMPPIKNVKIGYVRNLKNHCGAAFPPSDEQNNKRCTRPFRELSFRYDGNVALCCDDFRGQYPIANIHDMDILSLWNHERFQVARIILYNGKRTFFPCNVCTEVSMRVGLLPDKQGKETLPQPTKEIYDVANNVSKNNKPLSKIYKRSWEK